jgi:hypothetical protein
MQTYQPAKAIKEQVINKSRRRIATYTNIVIYYPIAWSFTTYHQKNWSIRNPEVV